MSHEANKGLPRSWFFENKAFYLMMGDLDKPFHLPECECPDCERWRTNNDRPTHAELHAERT